MDTIDRLKKIDKWFKSEEGEASIERFFEELNQEEKLAAEIESKSTLKYKDGQKVMRGDVFINERNEQEPSPYGVTSYVYRINEDDTLDICLSSCFAWKINNSTFHPETSKLVRRNGKLQNPLHDNPIIVE